MRPEIDSEDPMNMGNMSMACHTKSRALPNDEVP